jgi:hypothetical protein
VSGDHIIGVRGDEEMKMRPKGGFLTSETWQSCSYCQQYRRDSEQQAYICHVNSDKQRVLMHMAPVSHALI